ncbi:trypsin-like serine peptidase [Streptomyces sporangiiformans]|uniref:Trypsin-like peptidase domain-containing protein n=1 Tax=Streptomyces sporangiiformans TaxID=2315329 RepID=A0A505DGA5_9ACTN|nr:serine protease [Streptomyces sporangiiformans]TPQ19618.1 trypsin-like peptidase domain-containing protein [Streptomyces sporangiiformans]
MKPRAKKPLFAVLGALVITGAGMAPAVAAGTGEAAAPVLQAEVKTSAGQAETRVPATQKEAEAPAVRAVDFAGTVALSNCSGSVVRMPGSEADDPALVLSNGHCLESGFPEPGEVIVDQPSNRTFGLLNSAGTRVATLRASKIAYATMTDTDMSLYQLTSTYQQIQNSYGIKALELNAARPTAGTAIKVVSGYWKRIYSCSVDGFAYRLKEGSWTWKDSVRYTSSCNTIGGTSGSPVIDNATGKVVAVNNTGNEDGGRCTDNNPCEVDQNGNITVRRGINYAQQTYQVVPCVGLDNKIDLSRSGCTLPKP